MLSLISGNKQSSKKIEIGMKKVTQLITVLFLVVYVISSCTDTAIEGDIPDPTEENRQEFDTTFFIVEGIAFSNGEVDNINFTSAEISGQIGGLDSNIPITKHGHVWSSSNTTPQLDNNASQYSDLGERRTLGSFKSVMTNLEDGQQYYARAYIVAGGQTIYHDQSVSFSTFRSGSATVLINEAANITENSFSISATLQSDGGDQVTEHGFIWASSYDDPTPEFNEGKISFSSASNNTRFTHTLQSLPHTSSFYIRAYAKNTFGTAYSETKFVRTSSPYVVTNGLLAYYRFEGDFDDEWGQYNGVNQRATFTANTVTGTGNAAQFIPSSGSHVVVPNYPLFNASSGSISVWLKSTNTAGQCILHGNNISNLKGFDIITYSGRIYFNDLVYDYCTSSNGWNQNFPIDLTSFLFDGQWHMLTVTVEPGEQKAYVDGTNLSTVTYGQGLDATGAPGMSIGRLSEHCGLDYYYNGAMDNLRIYNRVLSVPEIQEIFRKKQ